MVAVHQVRILVIGNQGKRELVLRNWNKVTILIGICFFSRVQHLYAQFATERDREERGLPDIKKVAESPLIKNEKPKAKNTICISGRNVTEKGQNLTEKILVDHFSEFGKIINTTMEIEKGRGFVTFEKAESSEKAILETHNKLVKGILLEVQLARRQPHIEPINDASSSAVWSSVAASHSQKGSHKDKREIRVYEEFL